MSSDTPRYRCATERAFLSEGSVIAFAKLDYQEGVGSRAEEGDEFDFEGEPAAWMEPINEAARQRCAARMKDAKRKTMNAELSAPNTPLKPPRSGMHAAILSSDAFSDVRPARVDEQPKGEVRAAPRRRSAAKAS